MNPFAGLDAREFRRRWAEVDAFVRSETGALTPRQRLEQLDALYVFVRSTGGARAGSPRSADEGVRRRWHRLRQVLGGRS